ncbi:hypothetical protein HDE_04128 [Halotydeus destructor]|nr:hypothetical protein HDE_04128 [Halotydeus destructor]
MKYCNMFQCYTGQLLRAKRAIRAKRANQLVRIIAQRSVGLVTGSSEEEPCQLTGQTAKYLWYVPRDMGYNCTAFTDVLGQLGSDGNYTGYIGQLQHGTADVGLIISPMPMPGDPFDYSSVFSAEKISFATLYKRPHRPQGRIFQYVSLPAHTLGLRCLGLTMIVLFFIVNSFYSNFILIDLVRQEKPRVLRHFSDILDPKVDLLVSRTFPVLEILRNSKHQQLTSIADEIDRLTLNKTLVGEGFNTYDAYMGEPKDRLFAHLSFYNILKNTRVITCSFMKFNDSQGKEKQSLWIPDDSPSEFLTTFAYSKTLDKSVKQVLDLAMMRGFEHQLYTDIIRSRVVNTASTCSLGVEIDYIKLDMKYCNMFECYKGQALRDKQAIRAKRGGQLVRIIAQRTSGLIMSGSEETPYDATEKAMVRLVEAQFQDVGISANTFGLKCLSLTIIAFFFMFNQFCRNFILAGLVREEHPKVLKHFFDILDPEVDLYVGRAYMIRDILKNSRIQRVRAVADKIDRLTLEKVLIKETSDVYKIYAKPKTRLFSILGGQSTLKNSRLLICTVVPHSDSDVKQSLWIPKDSPYEFLTTAAYSKTLDKGIKQVLDLALMHGFEHQVYSDIWRSQMERTLQELLMPGSKADPLCHSDAILVEKASQKLSYTYARPTFPTEEVIAVYDSKGTQTVAKIEPQYFKHADQVVTAINEDMSQVEWTSIIIDKSPTIDYNERLNKVEVSATESKLGGVMKFLMSRNLSTILGLAEGTGNPDLKFGKRAIFVYSDLVKHSIVGDTYSQLLKLSMVPNGLEFGKQVIQRYEKPIYIPLQNSKCDSIEIQLRDDAGELIDFSEGQTYITLHFRKRL